MKRGTAEWRDWVLRRIQGQTVPVPDLWPVRMRDLVRAAQAAGWAVLVGHAQDSGGSPYLTVTAVDTMEPERLGLEVKATWHTRATGTYRLFSCLLFRPYRGWVDVTVTRAIEAVSTPE